MKESNAPIVIVVILAAGAGGAFYWWHKNRPTATPPAPAPVAAPVAPPLAPVAPTPVPVPAEPTIRHPVAAQGGQLPALDGSDAFVKKALGSLLGRKAISFLALDSFARNFVSTVDGLATEQASAQRWPVHPTPGQFEAESSGAGLVIGTRNEARYAAFIRFVEAVDTRKAVAVYRKLYPLFQQAYEELGYPDRYFNDRAIDVIDHLTSTPDVAGPIAVKKVETGTGAPTRPGGLYQFADPALEARSAGQKIMLRLGRQNAYRLKVKLTQIRKQISTLGSTRRRPPR